MENNRPIKNIIIIAVMILSLVAMIITSYIAKNDLTPETNIQTTERNNQEKPPEKPPGEMGQPPEKPQSDSDQSSKEEDKSPSMGSDALEKSTSDPKDNKEEQAAPPEQNTDNENKVSVVLPNSYYIVMGIEGFVFSACLMYLLLSKFNEKDFQDIFLDGDKIAIFFLSTIIITILLVLGSSKITNNLIVNNSNDNEKIVIEDKTKPEENFPVPDKKEDNNETNDIETTGTVSVIDDQELTGKYTSTNENESVILVKNSGNATINDITIIKSGAATNIENSEFYGVNSAILVQKDSEATIKNATISTSDAGSNAVFSTGTNSKINISDSTIETTGKNSSRGLDATYGGYIEADNVKITTNGGSCATLATDRGEGTVIAKNSTLKTNGKGSPLIYSTGNISIENTTGTAYNSQMVVVEGKNSATVTDSNLIATGIGNRNNIDKAGIMIYQSMSGDAGEGKGTFNATNSTLTITDKSEVYKTAPMFFVTNTTAEINLTNTKLSYGSNILLSIAGTSEWGKTNENGGIVTLNTNNQTMSGRIIIDSISSLNMNLVKTSFKGAINTSNTAKEVNIKLDKNSTLTLTADAYVTSLENEETNNSNIEFNNHNLYVNGSPISRK